MVIQSLTSTALRLQIKLRICSFAVEKAGYRRPGTLWLHGPASAGDTHEGVGVTQLSGCTRWVCSFDIVCFFTCLCTWAPGERVQEGCTCTPLPWKYVEEINCLWTDIHGEIKKNKSWNYNCSFKIINIMSSVT